MVGPHDFPHAGAVSLNQLEAVKHIRQLDVAADRQVHHHII